MHYTLQKLPNEPITVWTPTNEWDWEVDLPLSVIDILAIWEPLNEQVYHIINTQHYHWNLDGLTAGAASVAFGDNAMFAHPKLKMAVIVTQDPKVRFAVTSMLSSMQSGTGVYKSVPMVLMDTLDEALAYIRKDRGAK